jgi:hypothetical protein
MLRSRRVMMTATQIRSRAERCECAGLRARLICRCPGMNGLRLQSAFTRNPQPILFLPHGDHDETRMSTTRLLKVPVGGIRAGAYIAHQFW